MNPRFHRPARSALAMALALGLAAPLYAAPGDPVGPEFRVNTTTADSQALAVISQ